MGPKRKVAKDSEGNNSNAKKKINLRSTPVVEKNSKRKATEAKGGPTKKPARDTAAKEVVPKNKLKVKSEVSESEVEKKVNETTISKRPKVQATTRKTRSKPKPSKNDNSDDLQRVPDVSAKKTREKSVDLVMNGLEIPRNNAKTPKKSLGKAQNKKNSTVTKQESSGKTPKDEIEKVSLKKEASDSSSSESDWEDVSEDDTQDIENYNPEIPKEGVEITLEGPKIVRKRERKTFDMMGYIRCQINRAKKEQQLAVHQVHLLCLLARGWYVNDMLNSDEVKALAFSLIPVDILEIKVTSANEETIRRLVKWFRETFVIQSNFRRLVDVKRMICRCFEYQKAPSSFEYNMMFVSIARVLKFDVRFCVSFYPISYKPTDLLKKQKPVESEKKSEDNECKEEKVTASTSDLQSSVSQRAPKEKKIHSVPPKKDPVNKKKKSKDIDNPASSLKSSRNVPRRSSKKTTYKMSSDEGEDDSDQDFKEVKSEQSSDGDLKKTRPKRKSTPKTAHKAKSVRNRKILSSDDSSDSQTEKNGVECWVEMFLKAEKKWICVECSENIINKPYSIERIARQPVSYVVSFDNRLYIKDVTKRYCSQWLTHTRKLRVAPDWWEDALEPFLPPDTTLDRDEDSQMETTLLRKPLPLTIGEYKNHPLYALKRHLLKFEALYPPDAQPVGFIKKEPVYARECVHKLHSRETWVKEARLVRVGEEPYKIVKARPKWDRIAGVMKTDLPLELFGHWQTEKYMPPIAWNGKVPRNEYGNVELFKPCMLPVGTVHLRNAGLNRVAKKLGIDCSPAVVGFDGHKGSIHPVFDGFVVCEEFKDTILEAWEEEQENIRKREEEKRDKRIYGNWKKLIKGLLIRERIKAKYAVS